MNSKQYRKKIQSKLTEEQEQAIVIRHVKAKYPKALFTVDLGGMNLNKSQRRIHSQRAKRGHPDLMFQEWFGNKWCGLAIEFKRFNNKPYYKDGSFKKNDSHLVEQLNYINDLKARFWFAGFVCGHENAIKVIDWYMEGDISTIDSMSELIYPIMEV
jgi:hypothetical protein